MQENEIDSLIQLSTVAEDMVEEVQNLKKFVEGIISLVDDVFQSFSSMSDAFLVSISHGALPLSSTNVYAILSHHSLVKVFEIILFHYDDM